MTRKTRGKNLNRPRTNQHSLQQMPSTFFHWQKLDDHLESTIILAMSFCRCKMLKRVQSKQNNTKYSPKCRQERETELTRTRSAGSSKHLRIFIDVSWSSQSKKSIRISILNGLNQFTNNTVLSFFEPQKLIQKKKKKQRITNNFIK